MKKAKSLIVISILLSIILWACKKETNPCDRKICLNGGTCQNGTCACPAGYTGNDCSSEIRTQYYGSYNTVTSCSTAYTITISSSSKGVTYVEIGNIDKLGSTVFAQFETNNQTTLVIPQQVSGGNTFQGSITYTSGFSSANISYTKTLSGGSVSTCTGTTTK